MTSDRDRLLRASALKLALFTLVALLVTLTVAATIRPFGGGGGGSYRALFTSASQIAPGDDVRASGVVVGRVDRVRLRHDGTAEVGFSLDRSLHLTTGTRAAIRYVNLVGDRTLTLVRGSGDRLPEGGTIPVARTEPALDLDELFDGFKPLFAALSPEDVNALALDVVRTLQGEGPTVGSLLQHTASLTRTVADRDAMIGSVIDNLTTVLRTVDDRHGRLDQLVRELTRFVGGVSADRDALGAAITEVGRLTDLTSGLLREARPGLRQDVRRLGTVAKTLNAPPNRKLLQHALDHLPEKFGKIARTASYGSWFNYYACELQIRFIGPDGDGLGILGALLGPLGTLHLRDGGARCPR
jgi:phospholipid/cholesterol/gamma-HCH transport system substrate-binding protein